MAVTITSPQSKFVSRSNASSLTISWSCQYPQSAYEITYRQKGTSAWSTFGKVTSTATSATINISNFDDFIEYHYRVISYAENKSSGSSVYNGSDTSAAYALMIVPDIQLGTLKVKYGDGMVEVPLYESVQSPDKIKIQNRMTALIDQNLSASTPVRVRENGETKTLAKRPESLGSTGQYAYAYMTQRYGYYGINTGTTSYKSSYTYYGGTYNYRYNYRYYTYDRYTYYWTNDAWDYYRYMYYDSPNEVSYRYVRYYYNTGINRYRYYSLVHYAPHYRYTAYYLTGYQYLYKYYYYYSLKYNSNIFYK